jgi:hypothetical protein
MTDEMNEDEGRRSRTPFQPPLATPAQVAAEPSAFPVQSKGDTEEVFFTDWQKRLTRNLARRSDGRWEPLSYWR